MAERLNDYERLTLINQFRILEALCPDDADGYAKSREILEEHYEANYGWLMFSTTLFPISEPEGEEVKNTFEMFEKIKEAMPEDFPEEMYPCSRFRGYCPEEERKFVKFSKFSIERMGWKDKLSKVESYESSSPMRETYRRMHREWKKLPVEEQFNIPLPQLKDILNAPNSPITKPIHND